MKSNLKTLMVVFFALFLLTMSGCAGGGSAGDAANLQPSNPGGIQWPTADMALISSLNGNSCETLTGLGAECFYNNQIVTPGGISGMLFGEIMVSNTMACAIEEGFGPAVDCGNLSDVNCLSPATNNNIYCWDFNDFIVINPTDGATQLGFDDLNYHSGPKNMSTDVNGNMCITYSIYLNSGVFVEDTTVCGTNLNGGGYLQ